MSRQVFTTGQVGKMLNVAPRTVAKWYDAGRLRGYRIPGSQDRRIPREALVAFLTDNGLGLPAELVTSPAPLCLRCGEECSGDTTVQLEVDGTVGWMPVCDDGCEVQG